MPETSASPLLTYGAKTTSALPEFGIPGRLLSDRTTLGRKKASWVEIVWIESDFLIFQKSAPKDRSLIGSKMMPKFMLFDFSGFRSGLPLPAPATALPVQSAAVAPGRGPAPLGQRIGSYAPAEPNAAKWPGLDSAALGARKPSAYEARSASCEKGTHFAETLGVVESNAS